MNFLYALLTKCLEVISSVKKWAYFGFPSYSVNSDPIDITGSEVLTTFSIDILLMVLIYL